MNRPYDIITFGDMCVDLIVAGGDVVPRWGQIEQLVDDYSLELGGSCCIFACQAAKLGLRVGILGRVGDDAFGRLILDRLNACGVDTDPVIVDPSLKTGLSLALTRDGDRAILTYLGSISAIEPGDVTDEFLASARHLHHGSYFLHTQLRPHMPNIFERAHAVGTTTSLDTNWDPDDRWNGSLPDLLAVTDLCLPNEQELLRIAQADQIEEAAARLRRKVPLLALKRGADGATLYTADAPINSAPLAPVRGGDSIGAGDSFDAGFLAGWLRDLPLDQCLAIGSYCGRSVAAAVGGLTGQPTWDEVAHSLSIKQ